MSFRQVQLPGQIADTLEELYHKAKQLNPLLNRNSFIEGIIKDWLEPYKCLGNTPQSRKNVVLRNNLRAAITLSGKTQTEISEITGISRSHLNKIMRGQSEPTISTVLLLMQALNYPPGKIKDIFFLEPVQE
ncbi:MAG: helix-turn-helix transcriptional regulator [Archaeoglobus sp.]|nr:helix-turn-helix transcriptional regulator [Archaeoglobus sp.]